MLCNMSMDALVRTLNTMQLRVGRDFDVVTISFDPREGPELAAAVKKTTLTRYADSESEAGWHFLTGDEASISAITEAVGFNLQIRLRHGSIRTCCGSGCDYAGRKDLAIPHGYRLRGSRRAAGARRGKPGTDRIPFRPGLVALLSIRSPHRPLRSGRVAGNSIRRSRHIPGPHRRHRFLAPAGRPQIRDLTFPVARPLEQPCLSERRLSTLCFRFSGNHSIRLRP